MDTLTHYHERGYVALEGVLSPDRLAAAAAAYEALIEKAMATGRAKRDPATGFLEDHRFQDPHHPKICHPAVAEAMAAPALMAFCRELLGGPLALHGIAAFAMEPDVDYCLDWHRDSYYAWGKDSEKERELRLVKKVPYTQVLVALVDDHCLWVTPGSHNRANTEEEEARFNEKRVGPDQMFPDAVRLEVKAGTVVPFDARLIHRGRKPVGVRRRCMFVVYGTEAALEDAVINAWADDPDYRDPAYLDSLPPELRDAVKVTLAATTTS